MSAVPSHDRFCSQEVLSDIAFLAPPLTPVTLRSALSSAVLIELALPVSLNEHRKYTPPNHVQFTRSLVATGHAGTSAGTTRRFV